MEFVYKARIADRILERKLEGKGAVLIEGPKWCGKTTTAEQRAKSILYMDSPENLESNLRMADLSPKLLLEGESPRLIDEWQLAPKLWDAIRFEADHRHDTGLFILTGSAVPIDTDKMKHPSFLMVLTAVGKYAYRRKDGVYVVPIGCLRD